MIEKIFHITFMDDADDYMTGASKAFVIKNWDQDKEENDSTFDDFCAEVEWENGTLNYCGYSSWHANPDHFSLGYDTQEIEIQNQEKVMNLFRNFFVSKGYDVTPVFDYKEPEIDYDDARDNISVKAYDDFMNAIKQARPD